MIDKIISEITPLYGVCSFEKIKDNLIKCRAINKLPKNPKSVIVMLFPYLFDMEKYIGANISKYACVRDYHIVITEALKPAVEKLEQIFPNNQFAFFADNSPIPEVQAAVYAGLGVRGKNGLLINKEYGSYVFIGEIVTDMELDVAKIDKTSCIGCGGCIEMCPDKALNGLGVDKEKCLSDITQRKGNLTSENIELMKKSGCLWGCDICQDVCPMNRSIKINPFKNFNDGFENKMRCDGDISDRAYAWRGIEVIKRNMKG